MQETDPGDRGHCGGGDGRAPRATTSRSFRFQPGTPTSHDSYAYWTDKVAGPNGKIRRLLADDAAAVPEDIATDLNLPEGIVTDDSYVYFKQIDALYRVPLAGGTPEQLSLAIPANDSQATAVYHVDAQYVYFAAGLNGGDSTLVAVAK